MANRCGEDVMPVGLGAGTEGYLLRIKPRIGDDDTGVVFFWIQVSQYIAQHRKNAWTVVGMGKGGSVFHSTLNLIRDL